MRYQLKKDDSIQKIFMGETEERKVKMLPDVTTFHSIPSFLVVVPFLYFPFIFVLSLSLSFSKRSSFLPSSESSSSTFHPLDVRSLSCRSSSSLSNREWEDYFFLFFSELHPFQSLVFQSIWNLPLRILTIDLKELQRGRKREREYTAIGKISTGISFYFQLLFSVTPLTTLLSFSDLSDDIQNILLLWKKSQEEEEQYK